MDRYVIQITAKNEIRCLAVPDDVNGISAELHLMQALAGGPVETVETDLLHPNFRILMLADEEGWMKDSPVNRLAREIARAEFIFGDVVLCKVVRDDDGEDVFGFFTAVEVIEMLAMLYEAYDNMNVTWRCAV